MSLKLIYCVSGATMLYKFAQVLNVGMEFIRVFIAHGASELPILGLHSENEDQMAT